MYGRSKQQDRGSFGSNFGFLMAAIGSAVGLGNIWGFPYKMGKCGGFAFLLVYLCLAVFVGLCVMVGEMAIGRKTGQGVVGAYHKLAAKYTWVGWAGIVTGFCILCFYLVLGGMVTRYACGYLLAMFGVDTFGDPTTFFGRFLVNGGSMVLWFFIFTLINVLIVSGGIRAASRSSTSRNARSVLHPAGSSYLCCLPARRRRWLQVHVCRQLLRVLRSGGRLPEGPEDRSRPDVLLTVPRHGLHDHLRLLP
jgi:hypothetical protein